MSRWLPQFYTSEWLGCDDGGEAEGTSLVFEWGPIYIEIVVARRRP